MGQHFSILVSHLPRLDFEEVLLGLTQIQDAEGRRQKASPEITDLQRASESFDREGVVAESFRDSLRALIDIFAGGFAMESQSTHPHRIA